MRVRVSCVRVRVSCVCVSKLSVNKLCESMHSKARMTCYHFIHNSCAFILYTISYLRCMNVAVTKCHACHTNSCDARQTQAHQQSPPSAVSATPATQSEGPCRQPCHPPDHVRSKCQRGKHVRACLPPSCVWTSCVCVCVSK